MILFQRLEMFDVHAVGNQDDVSLNKGFGFLHQLAGIGCDGACVLQSVHRVRESGWVEGGAFDVVAADGDNTGHV